MGDLPRITGGFTCASWQSSAIARLFHIARRLDWEHALAAGSYRISTLGRTLDEQGYIHLSFAHQVKVVGDA